MSSKYDLLIVIDSGNGINPGINDRVFYPGQEIKGYFDVSVYEPVAMDQMQVALLGFCETTFAESKHRDARTWKEKHIFLKEVHPALQARGTPYNFQRDANMHYEYSFQIPVESHCETCGRLEPLPSSLDEIKCETRQNIMSASITYQVEVSVESIISGNIFFQEKFVVQPIDNGFNPATGDIKRPFSFGEHIFKGKNKLFEDDPNGQFAVPMGTVTKKSKSLRSIFSSSSSSNGSNSSKSSKGPFDIPLRLGIRPSEPYTSIIPGQTIFIPPTTFLFEYQGGSLSYPPFQLACKASSKLGEFFIKSLDIEVNFPYIKTICAGRDVGVSSRQSIYKNRRLNIAFDVGTEFKFNSTTRSFQKEMELVEDITGHMIDIPIDAYSADFPLHCNQIARRGGALVYIVGIASTVDGKPEYLEVTVPFTFKGVQLVGYGGHASQSVDYQRPSGPPPGGDFKAPSGPPPAGDFKAPSGPPPGGDFKAPAGPPPPTNSTGDHMYAPPPGPPPTQDQQHVQSHDTQNEDSLPIYSEVAK
ncbi:hypothetical protein CAAN1_06S06326 [[Candida] anglica]|uniref:Arrestin-like N-terminal domain-containing protein n=1 Tax=[Candida] anglica TaxID=148631 RepID=A0ABP0EKZ3_9ASCO